MWDNRANKRNPKAPDFKCRDRSCDGRLWPGQFKPEAGADASADPYRDEPEAGQGSAADARAPEHTAPRDGLHDRFRRCYLDVTDFALTQVRPKYEAAGLVCTDATVAAIVATLFIARCRIGGAGGVQ
jgi:hypothetical protein